MKILTPDFVDVLFRLFKPDASGRLSLGILKVFPLVTKEQERAEPLPAVWPLVKGVLGKEPLDAGLPKARGEFLAYGSAYKPASLSSQPLLVEVCVGQVSKRLAVFGDRQFNALSGISAPKAFSSMPITPENAFGGDGFADNPAGKGLGEVPADPATGASACWPLPNIESPDHLFIQRGDRVPAAGFWALSPDAPARTRLLGRFDQDWEKTRWPHLPLDTAPDFFQAAPVDQRLSGYWRGDEKIVLRNMHPQAQQVESALPGLRARCFIHRPGDAAESAFCEVTAHAETVWLFPEFDCGLILFRAVAPVKDEDGDDVAHVFVELENLSTQPLPPAHYWQLFQEKIGLAKPAKAEPVAEAAAPASAAPAAVAPSEALAADAGLDALAKSPAIAEIEKMTAEVDAQVKALMAQHGLTPADLEKFLPQPAASKAPMQVSEIEKAMAQVEAQVNALMAKHGIAPAEIERYMAPPVAKPPVGGEELGRLIADVEKQTEALIARSGLTTEQMATALAGHPQLAAAVNDFVASGVKGVPLDFSALFAQIAALSPKIEVPPPPAAEPAPAVPAPPVEAAPERLDRQGVIARHAAGQSLAGCELSAVDLSGLDLSGADFSGALLAGASFAGSRLVAAKFADALLQKVDFSAATLDGALLAGASGDGAKFTGSRLQKVDASNGDFSGADFSGADLSGAMLAGTVFAGSRMAGLQAKACVAEKASFEDCDLSGAVFSESRCGGARFNGAALPQASFAGANAEKAEFFGVNAAQASFAGASLGASRANATSQFSQANFRGASLQAANWGGALLSRAVLSEAQLDKADLSRAQLEQASLLRASARETRFDKASLDGADLSGINLFKGSLRLAKLGSARLQMANLYGVNFYGAEPAATSVLGSNIDKTLLSAK